MSSPGGAWEFLVSEAQTSRLLGRVVLVFTPAGATPVCDESGAERSTVEQATVLRAIVVAANGDVKLDAYILPFERMPDSPALAEARARGLATRHLNRISPER